MTSPGPAVLRVLNPNKQHPRHAGKKQCRQCQRRNGECFGFEREREAVRENRMLMEWTRILQKEQQQQGRPGLVVTHLTFSSYKVLSESKEVQSCKCVFSLAVVLHVSFKHLVKMLNYYLFNYYKLSHFKFKKINCILSNNFYKCKQFINSNCFAPHLLILTFFSVSLIVFLQIFFSVKYKIN